MAGSLKGWALVRRQMDVSCSATGKQRSLPP